MRISSALLLFLICFSCSKKESFYAALNVNIKYCNRNQSDAQLFKFDVFRNDSLFKTIHPESTNILIDSLKDGKYRIDYETLFDQQKTIFIDVDRLKNRYETDLCIDYFDHLSAVAVPFVNLLKDKEEYTLEFVSYGCEHLSVENMKVLKLGAQYIIQIGDSRKCFSNAELTPLRHFDIELMNISSSSGCTTVHYYTVNYNGKETKITDSGCNWNGFHALKQALGFED